VLLEDPHPAIPLLTAVWSLPLAWRRVHPLPAISAVVGSVALIGLVFADEPSQDAIPLALLIAAYSGGRELDPPAAWLAGVLVVGALWLGLAALRAPAVEFLGSGVVFGGSWAIGQAIRRRDREVTAAREREREAVRAERTRIARELHDVVSHSLSVIAIQTQAVRRRLRPDQAREAGDLEAVERVTREALAEMRRLFGVLRADGEAGALAPQPGLGQLDALVAQAGVPVELSVSGERAPLPPGVDLAAYRIVQEALTNRAPALGGAARTGRDRLRRPRSGDRGGRRRPRRGRRLGARAGRDARARRALRRTAGDRLPPGGRLPGVGEDPVPVSVRVVIADDQGMVRSGLRSLLSGEPGVEVVAEAADGEQAVLAARRHEPNVVLMDIRMPVLDGLAATRAIVDGGLPARVLVLTTFDLDEYVFEALRAGASGFLLKDASAEELVAAVRTVAAGDGLLSPGVTRRVIEAFAAGPVADPALARSLEELSARERQVLLHLARGASNAEIAAALQLSAATVKTHVASVLGKLRLRDRTQAVIFAYESGLIRAGGPASS
jgi:DNA-binding NarL/FixJ family response regulator